MEMKPNINREVAIGLSVLGALLLVLGAVAVWRFSRPKAEAERMLAREEKHEEKREAQHPDATKPLEFPKHEGLKALDDLGHWNAAEKEKKKDVARGPSAARVTERAARAGECCGGGGASHR